VRPDVSDAGHLEHCIACGGAWFDSDQFFEFQHLIADNPGARRSTKRLELKSVAASVACPRCHANTLVDGHIDGHRAYGCSTCRGLFLTGTAIAYFSRAENPAKAPWRRVSPNRRRFNFFLGVTTLFVLAVLGVDELTPAGDTDTFELSVLAALYLVFAALTGRDYYKNH
jgi:hypothetical protein